MLWRLLMVDAVGDSKAPRGRRTAILRLEDGSEFEGRAFGALRDAEGEVVFTTGMVGYT
ncbi:MAG: carbamoyl-phosphate synthase domain-containing protein, partial [Rectinemataceae bacterium]